MKNDVVTYARVSSDEQVEGYSLSAQLRACREWAQRKELKVLKEFTEEGVSGAKEVRPALAKAIAYCTKHRRNIQYFVVRDMDRFARDVLVHQIIKAKLKEIGITLYSLNQPNIADDDPHGNFMETMFSAVAQLEREQILQRTMSGTKEAILKHGAWTVPPPYGYVATRTSTNVSTLTPHSEQSEVVLKAFSLYGEGLQMTEVCDKLNAFGYRTKRGNKFSKQTISHMLSNVAYIGKIDTKHFPDQLINGAHDGIVPLQLWEQVQNRRGSRSGVRKNKLNPEFPLTVTLRCYKCASPMSGSFSTGKSGKRFPYYHCRKSGCRSKNFKRDKIEQGFLKVLQYIEPTEECFKILETEVISAQREEWKRAVSERDRLDRQMSVLQKKRDAIEEKYIADKIDRETYKRQKSKIEEEIVEVGQARERNASSEDRVRSLLRFTRDFLNSISNSWDEALSERKRLIQRLVFPEGIRCESDGTFRTLDLPPLLRILQRYKDKKSDMVGRAGLEPATNWLRANCSTD